MLELKNVSFEVSDEKAQKEIIRGINLKIDDNKFVVITGPNGGGKSTLAKLIVGIEKPTSGQILFNGEDITEKVLRNGQKWVSVLLFSSRYDSKEFRCWI